MNRITHLHWSIDARYSLIGNLEMVTYQRWSKPSCFTQRNEALGFVSFCFFFLVLGFELKAYTLSHCTSPFSWWVFSKYGLMNYLPGLASNRDPPYLSASWVTRIIGVSHQCLASCRILSTIQWEAIFQFSHHTFLPLCDTKSERQ
jgi:hypothetical protein